MCYGLRSDFRGEAFPGSAQLLTLADDLEEMKTICACARKASMNMRIGPDGRRVTEGEQVEIGGNDRYRAVCPSCFYSDGTADADQAPACSADTCRGLAPTPVLVHIPDTGHGPRRAVTHDRPQRTLHHHGRPQPHAPRPSDDMRQGATVTTPISQFGNPVETVPGT
jgi:hypothetical protein